MNKKFNIIFALVMLSIFLIPTSFAIYKSQVSSLSSIVSAEWSVSLEQNGVDSDLTVIPGISTDTYTLNIKSLSEVDVKYSIVISNLPTGVEVSLNGVDFVPESNGTITFSNAGTILYSPTGGTNSHTLTFRGTNSSSFVNNKRVDINVIAEQIMSS